MNSAHPELQFSENLLTGFTDIDHQHRELFARANRFFSHSDDANQTLVLRSTLRFLAVYARYHFASEEHAMNKYGYEHAAVHIKHHDEFRKQIEDIENKEFMEGPKKDSKLRLFMLMEDWFAYHLRYHDVKLAEFLRKAVPEAALPDPEILKADGVHFDGIDEVHVVYDEGIIPANELSARRKSGK
jgi:hemerythrin